MRKTIQISSDLTFLISAPIHQKQKLVQQKRKKVGRPPKLYSLSKHPYEKENELETFALEIAGGKEEALLLFQKVQQK
jgi:predicted ArsR family transcriptional regulator